MAKAWLPRRTLVLASGNAGKLRELGAMLRPLRWSVRPQSEWAMEDSAVENCLSFIENALIKARHAARLTGLPALGADSGLVVDALDGGPGIYSSRFAGEGADDVSNNRRLLEALAGVGESCVRSSSCWSSSASPGRTTSRRSCAARSTRRRIPRPVRLPFSTSWIESAGPSFSPDGATATERSRC